MSNVTVQEYADVLSDPHALFWDGHCTAAHERPRIRLALAAKKSGALGVLLQADTSRDVWLMVSGLRAKVRGNRITLTGPAGLSLTLDLAVHTASGSLEVVVSDKKRTTHRTVRFAVELDRLTGKPGRPSANAA
jgi:hypothetical protein